ncbi:hypothetical protein L202_07859 [Cryptococcus amylolentus CBS 6039]|uniref:Asl1-like glycosyl hydrolase catalytic domain-containing protein n=2 Tax=Cryptococcus amylolentus TaxID=104669 RepID=A0A1E3HAG3_9TREE|nr:hypothetical protein L202_07859 [Cryptococcus amylolentus CBS 6039]ODN73313.1 hypothetical protein L202_07859 [Cryptococcus amylolentus CBS 6039]ODN99113.1 hypothetical protein I350_07268 [Cryptococcus amylolentus CBS 6273]
MLTTTVLLSLVQALALVSAAPALSPATKRANINPIGLGSDDTGYSSYSGAANLQWYYSWALDPWAVSGKEFVPMVWGRDSVSQVSGRTFDGSSYILGFNEPDQTSAVGGSAISASDAASLHQQWTGALSQSLKIGSPAVARGSTDWFNNWLSACNGKCDFDFVPIHFYGTNAADLISYIQSFPRQGKPIWVTEFACVDYGTNYYCNADEVKSFMDTAIAWFRGDGADIVERWAWFGAMPRFASAGNANGLENADSSFNDLGNHYLSL